jgi:undecaprenyl-diphosphatase
VLRAFLFLPLTRGPEGLSVSRPEEARLIKTSLIAALICLATAIGLLLLRVEAQAVIDHPLTIAVNRLSRRWPGLDHAALVLQEFNLPKGGLIFALAAGAFAVSPSLTGRAQLAAGCVAAALAAVISRATQIFLPNLPRPLFDPEFHSFIPPLGADLKALHDWSSYPSDNAALLFGVTLAVWFADRRLGALAFVVFLAAALARVYGGLHYPTDLLGGAALSAACVFTARSFDFGFLETRRDIVHRHRAVLAVIAFLFAFQAASLFDDLRAIAGLLRQWI